MKHIKKIIVLLAITLVSNASISFSLGKPGALLGLIKRACGCQSISPTAPRGAASEDKKANECQKGPQSDQTKACGCQTPAPTGPRS